MKTIPIYVGTTPIITDTIDDPNTGLAIDLTGSTVTLVVQDPTGAQASYAATLANQITNQGGVLITTPVAVSLAQQYWLAWWHVVQGSQTRDTNTFALQIIVHGQENPVPIGPCSSWISGDDVLAFCPSAPAAFVDQAAADATDVVFAATARQFKGVCQDTIRPSRVGCACWLGPAAGIPVSWGWWGAWYGWGSVDTPQPLGCGYLSEYQLAYPVSQILAVKVDGSILSPSLYRVDESRRLVRLNNPDGTNPGWPNCQNLVLPDTQPGTWSVTYTYGSSPPQLALDAAKQLACQLALNAGGLPCSLPTGASKVTRLGITIERGLLADWTKGGSTGLAFLDAAIRAYNPNGLSQAPTVYSPDLPKSGLHTGR